MSQLNNQPKNRKSLLARGELKPIQIDETILAGRTEKHETDIDDFLRALPLAQLAKQLSFLNGEAPTPIHFDDFDQRIQRILGTKNIKLSLKKLKKFLDYLKQTIKTPCEVMGRKNSGWEEELSGKSSNQKQSGKSKNNHSANTERFHLLEFKGVSDLEDGIIVNVQRLTDRKKFTLPLAELEATADGSPQAQLLDDYATWFFQSSDL